MCSGGGGGVVVVLAFPLLQLIARGRVCCDGSASWSDRWGELTRQGEFTRVVRRVVQTGGASWLDRRKVLTKQVGQVAVKKSLPKSVTSLLAWGASSASWPATGVTVDRLTDRKESRRLTVQVEHVFKDTQVASEADIKRQTDRQTDKYNRKIGTERDRQVQ